MNAPALKLIVAAPKFYVVKAAGGFYGRHTFAEPYTTNMPASQAACFNPKHEPNAKAKAEAIAARVGGRVVACFSYDVAAEAQ